MKASCAAYAPNQPDTDTEISMMKAQIQTIAEATDFDPRFILAIIMQVSMNSR
jgi:hypothetical protein